MNSEAPMCGNRRGFRRWIGITLVALPAAVLALGNLWLSCPPGRSWIASKIQHATRLETRVGGSSVWPWSGVSIHRVELLQALPLRDSVREPFARIETIRLAPVWQSWLRGKLELQSIELDSPRIVIPIELLADLARTQTPAPPVAAAAATPPASTPPASSQATTPATPTIPETPPKPPAIPPRPTGWLRLKNASFTLLSASSGKPWLDVSGLSGSIPVSGNSAGSSLLLGSVRIAGQPLLNDLNASLDWNFPFLSIKPLETDIHGIKCGVAAKVALLRGIPLQIDAQAPKQKPTPILLPADGHAEAESIAATARFRGFLLAPGSWQGDLVVEALSPSARIAGHDARFERGGAVTVLRGGMLSCVDARLIGDDLSLLGNATLLADGRAAAALRMVAPPDSATAIVNRVFPNIPQPVALTALSTPQRAAFDLEAFGNIRQIFLRLGKDGPVMELKH
jgi:hypothetical protein